ncbi:hypothetical protein AQUCO_01100421v1 [Aquilegia coerulea]|uniref:RRM domain-containing protein n=2 Tax=Aquilegia coerulea TaxID=218851 RepID=A0A2G5E712_AQUCA|nr:hypothetical protein AQUCO_01100421v1 [Aquilegia coerulea]
MTETDHDESNNNLLKEDKTEDKSEQTRKSRKKKRLLREAKEADKRGVCYMSRIPPHMDPLKLRQILSQYGDIERIYLSPENPAAQLHRKRAGGFRGQQFSEGWIEFTKKGVAKRVANMLNGEQIGGRKRSSFYYDLWNIKYLSKFKWDDLTAETAHQNAEREQKSALELAAAKRDRDAYRNQVDMSRQISAKAERLGKKQKVNPDSDVTTIQQELKVVRKFPQTQPFTESSSDKKSQLSKDILAGVFSSL